MYVEDTEANQYASACDTQECLGDALSETEGWYSDTYQNVWKLLPWLMRGGDYNGQESVGIFDVDSTDGGASGNYSFCVVIG